MSTYSLFEAFDAALTPSATDVDVATSRAVECAMALNKHYYSSGSSVERMTLIGSVPKQTALRAIHDVDLVFTLPSGTYSRIERLAGNGQSGLLQEVRGVLLDRYPLTEIRGDGPVVVVDFYSGPTVEIVPAVAMSGQDIVHANCLVPVTRGGGQWEFADYGKQFDEISAINLGRAGQFSRLIRYMKSWRANKSAVLPSLLIEIMAIDFFRQWDASGQRTSLVYDDWLIRDFLGYMIANQDKTYALAGSLKQLVTGYGWRNDAREAHAEATQACAYGESSASYAILWRKVLGDDFGK